jgi:hypothetical protein
MAKATPRPGRRRLAAVSLPAAGALAALLAACSSPPPAGSMSAPAQKAAARTVTARTAGVIVSGRTRATLQVLTGTTDLTIGMADLGTSGSLLRVVTPPGAAAARLRVDEQAGASSVVELSPSAGMVTVTLNTRVSWQLDLGGGTTRTVADLRDGQVRGIDFTAGSTDITVALPQPHGSVPIQLAGGATDLSLSLPGGVQAQVTAGGGAGEVWLEGADHVGVAGGSVFTTPGWTPGAAGFDIDATSGASRIAVITRAGS